MPELINIYQKLFTQHELLPEKIELDNENFNWPSNKTKFVFWEQEKLNFRVVNNKLLVDTPYKKELLEAWTTPSWYQKNTVEDMESRLEVDMNSPYLYGNKLDLNLEELGTLFLERLEEVRKRKLEILEKDTFLEDFGDSIDNENIVWPEKIKHIAERMKEALKKISNDKDCTMHKCPTCGIYSNVNNVFGWHLSPDGNPDKYPGTWKDLDYYIYKIMSNASISMVGQNRCWLCEMCRETWENKDIEEKLIEINKIDTEIYKKGKVYTDFPGNSMNNNLCFGMENIPVFNPDDDISSGYHMGDEMCPYS